MYPPVLPSLGILDLTKNQASVKRLAFCGVARYFFVFSHERRTNTHSSREEKKNRRDVRRPLSIESKTKKWITPQLHWMENETYPYVYKLIKLWICTEYAEHQYTQMFLLSFSFCYVRRQTTCECVTLRTLSTTLHETERDWCVVGFLDDLRPPRDPTTERRRQRFFSLTHSVTHWEYIRA